MEKPGNSGSFVVGLAFLAIFLLASPPLFSTARAQAQSNPAGLWTLFTDAQDDQNVTATDGWNIHYNSQLASQSYLNVTEEGKVDTSGTPEGEYLFEFIGYLNGSLACSGEIRVSFVFGVTGSVTGQAANLSASSPSITQSENQTSGLSECSGLLTSRANVFQPQRITGLEDLPWVDGYTFSTLTDRQTSQTLPGGGTASYQDIHSVTVGLWQLQTYCNMYTSQLA